MNSKPLTIISLYPTSSLKKKARSLAAVNQQSLIQADAELNRLKMCALTQAEQSFPHNYSREAHLCLNIHFYKGFKILMLTKVRNFVGSGVGCVHQIWEHLCKSLLRRLYNREQGPGFSGCTLQLQLLSLPSHLSLNHLRHPQDALLHP